MTFTFWRKWLSRKRSPSAKVCPRPRLEFLEDRLAPATFTWTGAGTNNLWSNPLNWAGGVAPNPGGGVDTLLFGPGAVRKTAANDIPNAWFAGIQFTDSG